MQIGDMVRVPALIRQVGAWRPDDLQPQETELLRGLVVYIHPKGRYFTVEFQFGKNKLLESFYFQHTEEENNYENERHHEHKRRRWKNSYNRKCCGSLGKAVWKAGVGD